jgi:hypothetical protein
VTGRLRRLLSRTGGGDPWALGFGEACGVVDMQKRSKFGTQKDESP